MYKVIKYYSPPQEGSCVAVGVVSSLDSLVGSMLRNPSGPFTVVEQALYLGCNPVPCLLLAFPEPPLIVSVCQKPSSVPPMWPLPLTLRSLQSHSPCPVMAFWVLLVTVPTRKGQRLHKRQKDLPTGSKDLA